MSPNSSHPVQRLHPVGGDIVAAPGGATLDDLARISASYVLVLEKRVHLLEEAVFWLRGLVEKFLADSEQHTKLQDTKLRGIDGRLSNLEWRVQSISAQVKARPR